MRDPQPVYTADVAAALGYVQCELCERWEPEEETRRMEVDERGAWRTVCAWCVASAENR